MTGHYPLVPAQAGSFPSPDFLRSISAGTSGFETYSAACFSPTRPLKRGITSSVKSFTERIAAS